MRDVSDNKTILSQYFFYKTSPVYETMCKNMVVPDRPHMTIQ